MLSECRCACMGELGPRVLVNEVKSASGKSCLRKKKILRQQWGAHLHHATFTAGRCSILRISSNRLQSLNYFMVYETLIWPFAKSTDEETAKNGCQHRSEWEQYTIIYLYIFRYPPCNTSLSYKPGIPSDINLHLATRSSLQSTRVLHLLL